jgi:hypothetical protein
MPTGGDDHDSLDESPGSYSSGALSRRIETERMELTVIRTDGQATKPKVTGSNPVGRADQTGRKPHGQAVSRDFSEFRRNGRKP